MEVIRNISKILQENSYILVNARNEAIVIDPGFDNFDLFELIKANKYKVLAVLLTHGHFDHSKDAKVFLDQGIPVLAHKLANKKISKDGCLSYVQQYVVDEVFESFEASITFDQDCKFGISDFNIQVICTPGHSEDSVCYLVNGILFSGDTLFANGSGRTDFEDSNAQDMKDSIKKLFELPSDTPVYPGHSFSTLIGNEKLFFKL